VQKYSHQMIDKYTYSLISCTLLENEAPNYTTILTASGDSNASHSRQIIKCDTVFNISYLSVEMGLYVISLRIMVNYSDFDLFSFYKHPRVYELSVIGGCQLSWRNGFLHLRLLCLMMKWINQLQPRSQMSNSRR
jgi:hypothetical protein